MTEDGFCIFRVPLLKRSCSGCRDWSARKEALIVLLATAAKISLDTEVDEDDDDDDDYDGDCGGHSSVALNQQKPGQKLLM